MKLYRPDLRGIIICVEYDDLLRITLPRNIHHFREILVVTSPQDERTQQLVERTPRAKLLVTDAFHRRGAAFNKGAAMEEGFDRLGRYGWLMILDADILLPREVDWSFRQIDNLYTPRRCILNDVEQFNDALDWSHFRELREPKFAGYCQLFHADDGHITGLPWYSTNCPHAGGSDLYFQYKWPPERKVRPPFNVLHLGEYGLNWFGRITDRLDQVPLQDQEERAQLMRRLRVDNEFRMARLPP